MSPGDNHPLHSIEAEQITFQKLRVGVEQRISEAMARDLELRSIVDHVTAHMVLQLRGYVLGHKVVGGTIEFPVHVTTPATWWDAWKRDVLPRLGRAGRWYLRRHPVRELAEARGRLEIEGVEWATFPETTLAFPKEMGHVHVMQQARYSFGEGTDRYEGSVPTRTIANEQTLLAAALEALFIVDKQSALGAPVDVLAAISAATEDSHLRASLFERFREVSV